MFDEVLTVSEINAEIKSVVENEFNDISVIGEISNFKSHYSGHWYFSVKDSKAQINCTMWKGVNSYVFFSPQDGMKVIIRGRITYYSPRGNIQIDVRSMKPAGQGELQMAYEKLKAKLASEGLFDSESKKSLPKYPQKIGIATAIGGAALKDMISVAKRRYPLAELIIAACKVQGEGAAAEIAKSINDLNDYGKVDVIIIGRGGGSLEDLWGFNEEIVARAIFASKIPIVSGVGHEIDFTIADFVSDLRAPTPTAAMELVTPDKSDLLGYINDFSYYTTENISLKIKKNRLAVNNILSSYGFKIPKDKVLNARQNLDHQIYKFDSNLSSKIQDISSKLRLLNQKIESANYENILRKGYSIVKQNGKSIGRSIQLDNKKEFSIRFYDEEIKVKNG